MRRTKRIRDDETETNYAEKKKKLTITEDKLSNLPEDVQCHILSFLDVKDAVKTSVLSKSWVSLWTSISVLKLSSKAFTYLNDFDKFAKKILSFRNQTVKLDKLTFTRRETSSAKILKTLFDYAFSRGVKHLEASIHYIRKNNNVWPVCLHDSTDSLVSLKLHAWSKIDCPLLGLKSGFKNLTNLNLCGTIIKDVDPFSGFPMLKKLKLKNFKLSEQVKTLNVNGSQLSELTIHCYDCFNYRCKLTTPKLIFFKFRGYNFPLFETHCGGLSSVETLVIDYYDGAQLKHQKYMFDDLFSLFGTFYNAKSLSISSYVAHLLSLFPDDLMNTCSPFRGLNCLKLDFTSFQDLTSSKKGCSCLQNQILLPILTRVKPFLLRYSLDAEFSIINLKSLNCIAHGHGEAQVQV